MHEKNKSVVYGSFLKYDGCCYGCSVRSLAVFETWVARMWPKKASVLLPQSARWGADRKPNSSSSAESKDIASKCAWCIENAQQIDNSSTKSNCCRTTLTKAVPVMSEWEWQVNSCIVLGLSQACISCLPSKAYHMYLWWLCMHWWLCVIWYQWLLWTCTVRFELPCQLTLTSYFS